MSKTAYQFDYAGFYTGTTEADASPLEPGVYLLPARCTYTPPPAPQPGGKWPRWNGTKWVLVSPPKAKPETMDPVAKLQAFLNQNPDVAALLQNGAGAANEQNT